jgi:hypothetical protein
MNSLEKKIHQEIDADKDLYCSETQRDSISQHRTRDNVQLEELIKEYKTEMKKQNVSKEIRTLNLKKALFCRVKTINERMEENDIDLKNRPTNKVYLDRKDELKAHKLFVLKYLTENILNGSPSKSKTKSVFSRMFSSRKAGGKTKKGRKTKTRKLQKKTRK